MSSLSDLAIIKAAFERVRALELVFGDAIPNAAIRAGFELDGERVLLENQVKGIFKPRQMEFGALSIKTTMRRDGGVGIYNDHQLDDGFYHYSFENCGPKEKGNKLLWECYQNNQPFIYFHAVAPAVYKALWPCFITRFDETESCIWLTIGEQIFAVTETYSANDESQADEVKEFESRYRVRLSKQRLHQASFREQVLGAYKHRCAITGHPEPRLIEAAHIIPDSQVAVQSVANGIALSKNHHRAYDANLIGIDPDYKIHVSSVLHNMESNQYIQDSFLRFEGRSLKLPRSKASQPDRDSLAERFEVFSSGNVKLGVCEVENEVN